MFFILLTQIEKASIVLNIFFSWNNKEFPKKQQQQHTVNLRIMSFASMFFTHSRKKTEKRNCMKFARGKNQF